LPSSFQVSLDSGWKGGLCFSSPPTLSCTKGFEKCPACRWVKLSITWCSPLVSSLPDLSFVWGWKMNDAWGVSHTNDLCVSASLIGCVVRHLVS
jgi:hypothetical protein